MSNNKRFAIIGAGPAGLTAAYLLLKEIPDAQINIYEATDRVGGISTTIEYKGNRIDIGGHRFFSKNKDVNDFWNALMPLQGKGAIDDIILDRKKDYAELGPDPENTDIVMLIRNRVSRIFYRKKFFDYPISLKIQTFLNMGFINTFLACFSFLFSTIKKRPENSLEDFYINRFGKHLYSMFFEDYTEKVWGVHPSKLSASWGAQRVKELSITAIIKEAFSKTFNPSHKTTQTSLIEQFIYPKLGPGQLWSIVADKIIDLGGAIHFNSTVTGIVLENDNITRIIINNDNDEHPCDCLLSTMSIKDLVLAINLANQDNVTAEILEIAKGLPYRDFITVGLLLKKLKLKNRTKTKTLQNLVPDCWIYIQEKDVRLGRLQIFNNWSPYMVKDPENTVWIGLEYFCNEGDPLWEMKKEDFIEFAIDELVKIGIIEKEDVLDATQEKIFKAYPSYFGTYNDIGHVQEYLDSFKNLFCLGRNGQHKYNNMDHSMLTAMEAVNIIKTGSSDKSILWKVNTEKDYHEK